MKKTIRLNEGEFKRLVTESVKRYIKEMYDGNDPAGMEAEEDYVDPYETEVALDKQDFDMGNEEEPTDDQIRRSMNTRLKPYDNDDDFEFNAYDEFGDEFGDLNESVRRAVRETLRKRLTK